MGFVENKVNFYHKNALGISTKNGGKSGAGQRYSQSVEEKGTIGFSGRSALGKIERETEAFLRKNPGATEAKLADETIQGNKEWDNWRYYRDHAHSRIADFKERRDEALDRIDAKLAELEKGGVSRGEHDVLTKLRHAKANIEKTWADLTGSPPELRQKPSKFKKKLESSMDEVMRSLDDAGAVLAALGSSGAGRSARAGGGQADAVREYQERRTDVSSSVAVDTGPTGPEITLGEPGGGGSDSSEDLLTETSAEFGKKNMTIDEMIAGMEQNPKKVMKNLESLSPQKRKEVQMFMQQRLQQINQMFSMMSNISKSLHKTQNAIVNNMRV